MTKAVRKQKRTTGLFHLDRTLVGRPYHRSSPGLHTRPRRGWKRRLDSTIVKRQPVEPSTDQDIEMGLRLVTMPSQDIADRILREGLGGGVLV